MVIDAALDALIEQARRAGRHKTKKETIRAALGEYIRRRGQVRVLEAFGSFEFGPAYDYKRERGPRKSSPQRLKPLILIPGAALKRRSST